MNLSLFDELDAPVPEPPPDKPGPAQPLRASRARGRGQSGAQGKAASESEMSTACLFDAGLPGQVTAEGKQGVSPGDGQLPPLQAQQQQVLVRHRQPVEAPATQTLPAQQTSRAAETPLPIERPAERPAVLHSPEVLHPSLWRADQLGSGRQMATSSGFASLDAELPGAGWPHRALTELLLPHSGLGELRLLAPALAAVSRIDAGGPAAAPVLGGRCVMLFDPPADLYASALAQLGVDARQWLVVRGRTPHGRPAGSAPRQGLLRQLLPQADVLWALEQALKSGHVGAVIAWLAAPVKADALRRLQLAAQAHDGPAFIFRDLDARQRPSAAPLRLALQCGGTDALLLHVLKRRGPPLLRPLQLVLPPVLSTEPEERAQGSRAALAQLQARRTAFARRRSGMAAAVQQAAAHPALGAGWPR